jgi:hypothetical protein
MGLLSPASHMKEMIEEDRISTSPLRVGMLEEKLFTIFEAVQKNKDYIAMRSISAFDGIVKMDERLDELRSLHETFRMSVLPDGGLKWMVLNGREKMGREIALLSPLCQDFYEKLVTLLERTCGQEGFCRARQIAMEQLKRLTSDTFRKQFQRDSWAPEGNRLARYLEDDDWFRGFAEGLSGVMLELVASASVLKGAFMEELDIIFCGSAEKTSELEEAQVPVPEEFLAHLHPSSIDRQRRIFVNIPLVPSESILERYLAEKQRFVVFADAVIQVRTELETMVKRTLLYHEIFELDLTFSHPELDSYIGYLSPQDRLEDERAYILRYLTTRRTQLDAQKRYYLMKLWRMTPQQLERVRLNASAEWESFRKSENDTKAKISDTIRMLKGHGRQYQAALNALECIDKDNVAQIDKLPSELDTGQNEEELSEVLSSLKKCLQNRIEEFMALAALLREDVSRVAQMVEAGSLPAPARQKLLAAVRDFNDIDFRCESSAYNERYSSAVEYYRELAASRKGLGDLCLQLIKDDLRARCRELEEQDKGYTNLLGGVLQRFDIPGGFCGPTVTDVISRYEEAQEHIYKETEGFISGYKEAVLEASRGRIEKAQRTIILDQMTTKLEAIAFFVPRKPTSPTADVGALEKMRKELFGPDLLADAQQYWMKVRELCEAISASIRIHLDFSMVTEEDRKAGWEAVLGKLDSRFIAIIVTLENRLKEIDSVLGQIPEFNDVRLAAQSGPDLKTCAGNEQRLPTLRLQHLEGIYKAIHSARQKALRQFKDIMMAARDGHLPSQFVSGLALLAEENLDAAMLGLVAFRSSLREWLRATIDAASVEFELPHRGKWEMPEAATVCSWLDAFGEFLAIFSQRARTAIEEAAALGERMTGSEELCRIKSKLIGGCHMRELLEASDSTEMKEIAYLLFHGEHEIEAARRDIELALNRHDLQGVLDGCRRWKALQRQLEQIAAMRHDSWKTTLLEDLGDFEDRRLREYNLSKNKAGFRDRVLIEDIQRAIIRCNLRDKKPTAKEFNRLMRTLHKDGQVRLTDHSDAMFLTPGEYPEYGLTVAVSEEIPNTACTAVTDDLCLEFTYKPKKMLLVLKGS